MNPPGRRMPPAPGPAPNTHIPEKDAMTTQTAAVHEIIARQHATPVLVLAVETQPGLFVYRQPAELRQPGDRHVWRLGHHSGYQIAKFEDRGDAENAARSISGITDWTRPADAVRADTDGKDVREALLGSRGVFLSSAPNTH